MILSPLSDGGIGLWARRLLPAVDARLLGIQNIGQRPTLEVMPLATPVDDKPMAQNCVDPTSQVYIATALVPARERPLEAVLNEIVGSLSIAPQ